MMRTIAVLLLLAGAPVAHAQYTMGVTPTGTAGGDLSGSFPNPTVAKINGATPAASATTDTTSASNITAGTLAAARGGAGTISGALKANGSGVVSQAACADLSNAAASCSTDATNASNITAGTLAAARGGAGTVTGALKGNGSGVVTQAACADLSNAAASCSTDATNATNITTGTLATGRLPTIVAGSATQVQYNKASAFAGSANMLFYDTALPTPSSPALSYTGTAGATTYYISVVAKGQLGFGIGSPLVSIGSAASTLNGSNFITVTTAAVAGSTSCDVYDSKSAQLLLGNGWRYVGNVACGSAINDTGGTFNKSAGQITTGNSLQDGTAGVYLGTNMHVAGALSVGNAVPLQVDSYGTQTSAQLSVGCTVTGTAASGANDPMCLYVHYAVAPVANSTVGQPWAIYAAETVASGVTTNVFNMNPITALFSDQGSGTIQSVDGFYNNNIIGASVADGGNGTEFSYIDGFRTDIEIDSNNTFSNIAFIGAVLRPFTFGSGTLADVEGLRIGLAAAWGNYGSGTITNLYGVFVEAPVTGTTTNYEGLRIADGHAVGGTTSYAIHTVGALAQSLFEGKVRFNSGLNANGTDGVTCGAGVTAGTVTVSGGIVTHC